MTEHEFRVGDAVRHRRYKAAGRVVRIEGKRRIWCEWSPDGEVLYSSPEELVFVGREGSK